MSSISIGLLIIAIGWIVQFILSWRGNREIQPLFVVLYIVGVLVVASGSQWDVFQLITIVAAGLVLIRLLVPKKS